MPQDAEIHMQQKQPDVQPEDHEETEQEGDKENTDALMVNQIKGTYRGMYPHICLSLILKD
jgi:hypothetical protein